MTKRSDPNPIYWEQYGPSQHVKHELIRCYLNGLPPSRVARRRTGRRYGGDLRLNHERRLVDQTGIEPQPRHRIAPRTSPGREEPAAGRPVRLKTELAQDVRGSLSVGQCGRECSFSRSTSASFDRNMKRLAPGISTIRAVVTPARRSRCHLAYKARVAAYSWRNAARSCSFLITRFAATSSKGRSLW